MTSPYPHPSPNQRLDGTCLPERPRSPTYERKEAPRWRGRVREELSKVGTAHAVPVDVVKLAPPFRWRCDGDHKNALFCQVLHKTSPIKSRRVTRSPRPRRLAASEERSGRASSQS